MGIDRHLAEMVDGEQDRLATYGYDHHLVLLHRGAKSLRANFALRGIRCLDFVPLRR
jgi:hypothetical protein